MARNRTSAQKSAAKRRGIIYLSHQRRLPANLPRIHRELIDAGEGRLEERAELAAFAPGWPRETQTAKVMKLIQAYKQAQEVHRTLAAMGIA
jgi:hypothetical protein